jgi:hypothetical protein
LDAAAPENRARRRTPRRSAHERAKARRQLLVRERLREVVVGAGVEAGDTVRHGVARGEHQDRHVRALRPQAPRDLETRRAGQDHVEHDRVEHAVGGERESLVAVRGDLDHVAVLGEQAAEQLT